MKKKRITAIVMSSLLALSLAACGGGSGDSSADAGSASAASSAAPAESTGEKIYHSADSWLYPSLNPHVDYQGWQEFSYGNTEMLFHIENDGSVVPWLAESAEPNEDASVWTLKLRPDVTFSDGTALDAEQVIANLEDIREKNTRFGFLEGAEFAAEDDQTVVVTLTGPYSTFTNDLADPDAAIIKIGEGEDLDLAPVSTGPFVVTEFVPETSVKLAKSETYWNGEAKIDGAEFNLVVDQETQTMAMQSGEISSLYSPSAEAIELFSQDPDNYDIVYATTSRLYMYYLNFETLEPSQREAIIKAVTVDDFATSQGGLVEEAQGPFLPSTAFGKASGPSHSIDEARAILEADGYTLNDDGYYEKNGEVPVLRLCYYPARQLDKLVTLMQEQLKEAGIMAEPMSYEDPDAGYVTTGDFEIGLYNLISAPSGDPYYFLNLTMGDGPYNAGHYVNADVQEKLSALSGENDPQKRADLANEIVQQAIDDNAYGYLGFLVKATVLRKGVKNVGEDNPYHGGLNADTVME